jgi:hypothetical protein
VSILCGGGHGNDRADGHGNENARVRDYGSGYVHGHVNGYDDHDHDGDVHDVHVDAF